MTAQQIFQPMFSALLGLCRKNIRQFLVKTIDERYSSVMASRAMIDMGMKKSRRREKGIVDQVAATMMLQEYLLAASLVRADAA